MKVKVGSLYELMFILSCAASHKKICHWVCGLVLLKPVRSGTETIWNEENFDMNG